MPLTPESATLDAAAFAAVWRRLGGPKKILVAVSGGSDSTALLHLAAQLGSHGATIAAATVDHGLRAQSHAEALMVSEKARTLGVRHTTLQWQGEKPETALQASAREARYFLLARHAVHAGFDAIMTGHTADDQDETVYMRLARSAGRGARGMDEESLIAAGPSAPVRLLRPLLGWRRDALRAHLAALGSDWIDDPSNEDLRFERVRVRSEISECAARDGEFRARLAMEAAATRKQAHAEDEAVVSAFKSCGGMFLDDGSAALSIWPPTNPALGQTLLARLAFAIGGGAHAPAAEAAGRLAKTLAGVRRGTLAGALFETAGAGLTVRREPAALLGRAGVAPAAPVRIDPGEAILWDRRFIVRNPGPEPADAVPLGLANQPFDPTAPALRRGGRLVAHAGEPDSPFTALTEERFFRRVNRFNSPYKNVKSGCGAGLP